MKTIKHLTFFLSALFMLSLIPCHVQASHAIGMELTYTHLSGALYKFRCVIYRDCTGIPGPSSITMHANSLTCGIDQYFGLDLDTSQTHIIPITCPYDSTTCVGGSAMGIKLDVYEKEITLTGQCSDWLFEVVISARSAFITTLINPGSDDLYVAARLNNLNSDNTSPQFTNDPIVFVCIDQDFHYNHGMFDPDGDSISYQMIAPRTSLTTTVVYNPGYSVSNPLSSLPPVSFNNFTGDLLMHSLNSEIAVIAYEIRDYRNGVIVGSVVRDIIVITVPCGTYPTATGMNGTTQQFLYVFPDDTVCFDVLSDDIDANDTVTMTWNQTIPNATFVTNGIPYPTGTFCWTPSINNLRSQPYMFTVMVYDNACPVVNACIYSYFIYVTLDSSLVWAGINDPELQNEIFVYPNPSSGLFELKSDKPITEIKIYNYTGECIREDIQGPEIDLRSDPHGIYFIEVISSEGKRSIQKIVKTRSD